MRDWSNLRELHDLLCDEVRHAQQQPLLMGDAVGIKGCGTMYVIPGQPAHIAADARHQGRREFLYEERNLESFQAAARQAIAWVIDRDSPAWWEPKPSE